MRVEDQVLAAVRERGFAIIFDFLDSTHLQQARAELFTIVPDPVEYFSSPGRFARLVTDQFAGIINYPFDAPTLNFLGTHSAFISAAERHLGTTKLAFHSINIWAKYAGNVDYEQTLHRDYPEKTTVVPSGEFSTDQITFFLMLSNIGPEDAPTIFVDRPSSRHLAPSFTRQSSLLSDSERPVVGAAGSVYLFDYLTLHRASGFKSPTGSRFLLSVEIVRSDRPWLARTAWAARANGAAWQQAFAALTPRQRELFGVPAPGDSYWTASTVASFGARHPEVDLGPYSQALGRTRP